jgi:hypothetical protein
MVGLDSIAEDITGSRGYYQNPDSGAPVILLSLPLRAPGTMATWEWQIPVRRELPGCRRPSPPEFGVEAEFEPVSDADAHACGGSGFRGSDLSVGFTAAGSSVSNELSGSFGCFSFVGSPGACSSPEGGSGMNGSHTGCVSRS